MQILNDKSLHSKLITPTGKDILPEAPFNRVCDLLGHDPPAEFAPLFTPFLDDPSKEIRKDAALVLGNIGTETIIAPVRKALLDPDEYVRSYALIGFERARAEQRLGDSCRQELFPDLQRLLSEGQNGDKAASLLLEFDEQQAMNFFLSEAVFTPKFMSLHDVLHALNEKRLLIPRDRLLALIEELETDEQKYPRTYQLGEALQSLGRHQVHDDQAILVKHLEHAGEIVAEGAAFGLAALNGLEGFRDRIWATLRRRASLP